MAKVDQLRPRVNMRLADDQIIFDPVMGQLSTPPAKHYTGELVLKIGAIIITIPRDEFEALADKFAIAKRMLDAGKPTGEPGNE